MGLTKKEVKILVILKQERCFSKIESLSLREISEKSNTPMTTIRHYIKSFLLQGLVEEGARDWSAKTYFINQNGLNIINEYCGIENE